MAGFVMPACSTARLKALKGLVIHVMATHDTAPWIGRMRVLRKNPEPRPECPARGYFRFRASGSNAARPLGLVLQPPCPCTRQLSRRLGAKLSVTSRPDPWSPCPPAR